MKLTPAMQQYMDIKKKHPDGLILFRMGDFYETFFDDAITISEILHITLTARNQGESKIALAGFPYHAMERYVPTLVKAGHKVVIVEQMENPKDVKGIVKREVTRVITPGTVVEDYMLDQAQHNFIAIINLIDKPYGFVIADVSTQDCFWGEAVHMDALLQELQRYDIKEIVIPKGIHISALEQYTQQQAIYVSQIGVHVFAQEFDHLLMPSHTKAAVHALLAYCKQQHIPHTNFTFHALQQQEHMMLDSITIQNLELLKNSRDNTTKATLLETLQHTHTPMGNRLLKQYIIRPLCDQKRIEQRLACVRFFMQEQTVFHQLKTYLKGIGDIQRLTTKISCKSLQPKDAKALEQSLIAAHNIQLLFAQHTLPTLLQMPTLDMQTVHDKIKHTIVQEPPTTIKDGHVIAQGVNEELDALRNMHISSTQILAQLEQEEVQKTNIPLKIKYNRTFGYYVEISNKYKDKVPSHYIRKQTVVNAERYITEELKDIEQKILGAQERALALEHSIFEQLVTYLQTYIDQLHTLSHYIGVLDVMHSFAHCALHAQYCEPVFTQDNTIHVVQSRHPVIERYESRFVPNDCLLDNQQHFMVLTGPNMGGKSTYMRQIALCVLLAHMGCYVPAKQATLCIVDRIFSRVGASDNLAKGQSTFMVEMDETARILRQATQHSLLIIDEIGRGTSTYDGASLAWAIAQDIAKRIKAKTIFATHYHMLTQLQSIAGVINMHVQVHEEAQHITFLHTVVKGSAQQSYGIHVAQLAGIPQHVIDQAKKMQQSLEQEDKVAKRFAQHVHKAQQKDLEDFTHANH
ncbi:MAG: DNA mismatch repair protein MutS [Candidatus Woesearchaeota archaeon]